MVQQFSLDKGLEARSRANLIELLSPHCAMGKGSRLQDDLLPLSCFTLSQHSGVGAMLCNEPVAHMTCNCSNYRTDGGVRMSDGKVPEWAQGENIKTFIARLEQHPEKGCIV